MAKLGVENFDDYIIIRNADRLGQSDYNQEIKEKNISELKKMYDEVISQNQCLTVKNLNIDGKDLIALGMKPGKKLGDVLKDLLEKVLDEPDLNKKDELIRLAKNMIKE